MQVSRSAYYSWRSGESYSEDEAELAERKAVESCFSRHLRRYGSRRIRAQLQRAGRRIGRHKVRRLMHQGALRAIQPRSFVPRTTDSASTRHPAPNLLRTEEITAKAPNQVLVGDLTYLPLGSGKWAYLATWKDVFTRKIVGWDMAGNMRKELIINAFKKATNQQKLSPGLIVHSDQGSQYNSKEFKELLRKNGFRQSMSRKNEVLDNAFAESFFSRYKAELLQNGIFDTCEQAYSLTFEYIEAYFNRIRLHSGINYQTPQECENHYFSKLDFCPDL